MKIGKLYKVNKCTWFLYPTKERAGTAVSCLGHVPAAATPGSLWFRNAAYWSEHFKCNVTEINPNSVFFLLEQDAGFLKVLTGNGEVGWICFNKWNKADIEEVKQ
jgi:hypothetical protein